MSWNPVLNKFIEIKNSYIKKFGNITYDYVKGYSDESETCLERWVKELDIPEYIDILSCLELNQFKIVYLSDMLDIAMFMMEK